MSLSSKCLLAALGGSGVLLGACMSQGELEPVDPVTTIGHDDTVVTSTAPVAQEEEEQTVALKLPPDAAEGSVLARAPIQTGSAQVEVEVITRDGGEVVVTTGRDDELVLDLPHYEKEDDTPPRAIVRVTPPAQGSDPLAPGDADFTFGAEFRIDTESKGNEVDNGDNLIQRGLASDPSQYKLELDGDRAACRVRGAEGDVQVKLDKKVVPGSWYAVTCSRAGELVQITLTEYGPEDRTDEYSVDQAGATGAMTWPKAQTPMSVGGKLAANGEMIRSATDQFNGLVSKPFLSIDD